MSHHAIELKIRKLTEMTPDEGDIRALTSVLQQSINDAEAKLVNRVLDEIIENLVKV